MLQHKALVICIGPNGCRAEARRLLLEESGYQVLVATSEKDGLELFAQCPVDIVLLDYEMPLINGDLVAARMKVTKLYVPIVMFAGHRSLPKGKVSCADACVTEKEPWSIVLARVDELARLSAPFFARWLEDWKHRRASQPENSSGAPASIEDPARTIH